MAVQKSSSIPAPPGAPNSMAFAARIALVATLTLSPQLLGGVFPWAIAIICAMAAATGLLTRFGIVIPSVHRRSTRWLDWMVVGALGWTAFQLFPLPVGVVSWLVPETVAAWHATDDLFDRPLRAWAPLSLDPGATLLELAKGSAIVAMYLTARVMAASGRRRWVLAGVGASGAVMALVAFGHHASGATEVFGVYEPVYASSRLLAPLMNENHLGGFMALVTPILLGLALDAQRNESKVGWGALTATCAIAAVLTFSRGGILALAIGVGLFLLFHAVRRRRNGLPIFSSNATPLVAIGLLATLTVVAVVAGSDLQREFSYTHNRTVKLEAAQAALPVVAEHWLTGVGRGAFSAAFVGEHGAAKRFFYPENLLVQWTVEWGAVFAFTLVVAMLVSVGRAFQRERSNAHLGALAGIVAIAAHQMVDFSLELAGVAIVAAATLGAVVDTVDRRQGIRVRTVLGVMASLAVIGSIVAGSLHERDTFTIERELRQALEDRDYVRARGWVETGLALHPAEPTFVLAGAEVAVREGDVKLARWINHAQAIAPLWSAPHLLAARWLLSIGRTDQALVELRAGESNHPGSMVASVCALLEEDPRIEIVLRVTPKGEDGALFLDRIAGCLPWTSPLAAAIDAKALDRDPSLSRPALREAKRKLLAGDGAGAIAMLANRPELDTTTRLVLAQAYLKEGEAKRAEETLAPLLQQRRATAETLRTALAIEISIGDEARVRSVASRLRAQALEQGTALAEIDMLLGALYEAAGEYPMALVAYRRAGRSGGSRKSLESIARVSALSGDAAGALITYRRLCRADGGVGDACRTAEKLSAGELP